MPHKVTITEPVEVEHGEHTMPIKPSEWISRRAEELRRGRSNSRIAAEIVAIKEFLDLSTSTI